MQVIYYKIWWEKRQWLIMDKPKQLGFCILALRRGNKDKGKVRCHLQVENGGSHCQMCVHTTVCQTGSTNNWQRCNTQEACQWGMHWCVHPPSLESHVIKENTAVLSVCVYVWYWFPKEKISPFIRFIRTLSCCFACLSLSFVPLLAGGYQLILSLTEWAGSNPLARHYSCWSF